MTSELPKSALKKRNTCPVGDSLGKIGHLRSHGGPLTVMLELAPAFDGFETFYFC